MTENLVCFDVETTGLNSQNNYIIQLAMVKFSSKTFEPIEKRNWFIKPKNDFTIEESAFTAHHLSKEFILENGVTLDTIYADVLAMMEGCDILTYNGNAFDINYLYKDFKEYGLEIDFTGHRSYDAYAIECRRTSRRLTDVYRKYTGKDLEDAHNAFADVNATIEVFKHQLKENKDVDMPEFEVISPEGFVILKNDVVMFSTGKYTRRKVVDICREDPEYIRWVFSKCSELTKKTIIKEYYKVYPKKDKR